jgi:hypothetical protein
MYTAYLVITLVFALMVSYSGLGKIRHHPLQVKVTYRKIHPTLKSASFSKFSRGTA